jgi:hypothetical protein
LSICPPSSSPENEAESTHPLESILLFSRSMGASFQYIAQRSKVLIVYSSGPTHSFWRWCCNNHVLLQMFFFLTTYFKWLRSENTIAWVYVELLCSFYLWPASVLHQELDLILFISVLMNYLPFCCKRRNNASLNCQLFFLWFITE